MGNLLAAPLWAGSVSERDLRRRVAIQNNILQGTVSGKREPTLGRAPLGRRAWHFSLPRPHLVEFRP
jgi:hypothetical protein